MDIELTSIHIDQLKPINIYNNNNINIKNEHIIDTSLQTECCICLDTVENKNYYVTKCCKQDLHIGCFIEWTIITFYKFKYVKCPVCRNEISEDIIKNDISLKSLIEFKLHKPKYKFNVYSFIDRYFKDYVSPILQLKDYHEYQRIQLINRIDNSINNSSYNIDPETQISSLTIDIGMTRTAKFIHYAKISTFFLLISGFILMYFFTINNSY